VALHVPDAEEIDVYHLDVCINKYILAVVVLTIVSLESAVTERAERAELVKRGLIFAIKTPVAVNESRMQHGTFRIYASFGRCID
jgi:hypothetical protein